MGNFSIGELPEWQAYLSITKFSIYFLSFLAVGTVAVNGLTLFAIYKDPMKCFRTPLAIFITGVLLADLATGLVVEPYFAAIYSISHFSGGLAQESYMAVVRSAQVISSITINASFLTLLALAISQLVALGKPHIYEKWITRNTAIIATASIWVYVVLFALVPEIFTVNIGAFFLVDLILHTTVLTVALVVLYIITYFVFHKAVQRSDAGRSEENTTSDNQQRGQAATEREFIKGTFILTLLLILTVWPFTIALYVWLLRPISTIQRILEEQIALYACNNILFLKFLWDPVVFIWRVPKYRKAVVTTYAKLCENVGCVTSSAPGAVSYRPQRDEASPEPDNNDVTDVTVVIDEASVVVNKASPAPDNNEGAVVIDEASVVVNKASPAPDNNEGAVVSVEASAVIDDASVVVDEASSELDTNGVMVVSAGDVSERVPTTTQDRHTAGSAVET